ncbi:MAG: hypothetical protein ABJA70_22550 [Chryseolinea sp.]
MPAKHAVVKKAIEEVICSGRKGRIKVIKLVQRKYPELRDSKIHRVYEKEGFSLSKKLRRRIKETSPTPLQFPQKPIRNGLWTSLSIPLTMDEESERSTSSNTLTASAKALK